MKTYRTMILAATLSAAWCAAQDAAACARGCRDARAASGPDDRPGPRHHSAAYSGRRARGPGGTGVTRARHRSGCARPPPPPPAWAKDAYSRGTFYLDQRQWNHAIQAFNEAIKEQKARVDGAYYWRAYALGKIGRRTEAMRQLQTLAQQFPNSSWMTDAKALQFSLQQASGQPMPPPEKLADEDLKMLALNSLMMSDPDRAVPILEKMVAEAKSQDAKQQALFMLAQSDSPKAKEALAKLAAQGNQTPEMQRALAQVFMMEGNTDKLLAARAQQLRSQGARRSAAVARHGGRHQ